MRQISNLFVLTIMLLAATAAQANVALPNIFGDHMILQQQMPIRVFGTADAGEEVTVTFNGKSATARADNTRQWRVELPAMKADGQAYTLTVKGKNTIEFKDVMLGELWICSGQSNMEWPMTGGIVGQKEFIAAANHPSMRLFNVSQHIAVPDRRDNVPGQWQVCSSSSVAGFSAVGYFFGRKLHAALGVPVGLIGTNWGGTRIEPWTPPSGFNAVPELSDISTKLKQLDPSTPEGKKYMGDYVKSVEQWVGAARQNLQIGKTIGAPPTPMNHGAVGGATTMYNGMVHALTPLSVRGAIWYQGESNGNEGESYYHKMKALISGWRTEFENDDLGFYFVQLANFQQPNDNPAGGDGWANLREAQRKTLTFPHTGMATIIDIGQANDIHPRNKTDVGERLAVYALNQTYGKKDVVPSGPLYKSMKIEGDKIRISFDYADGLMVGAKEGLAPTKEVEDGKLARFAIAGSGKQWHWADVVIDGDTVVVSSDKVAEPVAVRYAFSMNPQGANLYNGAGLPASPFRTDNW